MCGLAVIRERSPSHSRLLRSHSSYTAATCVCMRIPPERVGLICVHSLPQIHALCCAAGTGCTRKEGVCAWRGGRGQSVMWRKVSASTPPAPTTAPAFRESAYVVQPTRALTVSKVRCSKAHYVALIQKSIFLFVNLILFWGGIFNKLLLNEHSRFNISQ